MIALEAEKSPVRYGTGGTNAVPPKLPESWRPDSQLKKKKVLFFLIGPPMLAPTWLRFSRGGAAVGD